MTEQLTLNFPNRKEGPVLLETAVVSIDKDIPLDVFMQLHHIAFFMEYMERKDGKVLWDPSVTAVYSEKLAEAEWIALQNGWIEVRMELPVELIKSLSGHGGYDDQHQNRVG